jgi:uncharacterized protein YjbI with pentapeptide repeats
VRFPIVGLRRAAAVVGFTTVFEARAGEAVVETLAEVCLVARELGAIVFEEVLDAVVLDAAALDTAALDVVVLDAAVLDGAVLDGVDLCAAVLDTVALCTAAFFFTVFDVPFFAEADVLGGVGFACENAIGSSVTLNIASARQAMIGVLRW